MSYYQTIRICLLALVLLAACKQVPVQTVAEAKTANPQATTATKRLYQHIQSIGEKGIAFGHQDPTVYGVGWKDEDRSFRFLSLKSDVKSVTGKLPAVHGFDLGHIELGNSTNLDTVSFKLMREHIQRIHQKGGIITLSWHLNNPATDGSSWDKTSAVKSILPGGAQQEKYHQWMDRLGQFLTSLRDKNDQLIPVVFRPYHEMNGSWFWWGEGNCTTAAYKALWINTFEMLRERNVHNVLFAYAPNTLRSKKEFFRYYPGDAYVDILGVDVYNHGGDQSFTNTLQKNLSILQEASAETNKPYALTESGNIKQTGHPQWWTEVVYPGIKDSGIAWALFWRNARPSHYFTTYEGELTAANFQAFEAKADILFLDDFNQASH